MNWIDSLTDDGLVELGRMTHAQHAAAAELTPADGLVGGFAKIGDTTAVVLVEDAAALAHTDGQVAANKRQRLLELAIARALPVVYVADAPHTTAMPSGEGALVGGMAKQRPLPALDAIDAPVVAIVAGALGDAGARIVMGADVVLRGDDAAASARRVIALLPAGDGALTRRLRPAAPVRTLTDDASADGLFDAGSLVELERGAAARTGIGAIDGYPVAFVHTGADARRLDVADANAITRVARLRRRFGLPLVCVQDCDGYEPDLIGPGVRALTDAVAEMLASEAPLLSVIAGRGHALGDWLLGGRQLGVDYLVALPDACVGAAPTPWSEPSMSSSDVWLAAGRGIVDDVMAAGELRDRLAFMIDVLAPSRGVASVREQRRGRLIEDISKV